MNQDKLQKLAEEIHGTKAFLQSCRVHLQASLDHVRETEERIKIVTDKIMAAKDDPEYTFYSVPVTTKTRAKIKKKKAIRS